MFVPLVKPICRISAAAQSGRAGGITRSSTGSEVGGKAGVSLRARSGIPPRVTPWYTPAAL